MRKKAILEIPYLVPAAAPEEYDYVGAQKEQTVKDQNYLFVEIFENTKKGRRMPKVRMVFAEEDWVLYYPSAGTWSSGSFQDICNSNVWDHHLKQTTHMSETDQDAIFKWAGDDRENYKNVPGYTWEHILLRKIEKIREKRQERKMRNRMERLKERKENTPELPGDLKEWAERRLFFGEHFLFYKRKGRYAAVCCSKCGRVTTEAIKQKDTYEGQFERVIETPVNNHIGTCPMCKAMGKWKTQGKTRGVYAIDKYCFVGQPYKGDGAVIRYVQCEKLIRMNELADESGLEMTGAGESYIITEIARMYIEKGKKAKTDFHKYSSWSGDFWDDCNLYGMNNIMIDPAIVYDPTWKMLEGTILKYSGAGEFAKKSGAVNLMDYAERYQQYPQIEMFSKMGLTDIVTKMLKGYLGIVADPSAEKPEEFFGIYKDRLKLLISKEGDEKYLKAMQIERRLNKRWSLEELQFIKDMEIKPDRLSLALEHMSIKQLRNRIEKYSGCQTGGDEPICSKAIAALTRTSQLYLDYLMMRQQRGYDLNNTVYLYPRSLQRAHEQMVTEINAEAIEKRNKEIQEKYADIGKRYRKLRKRYFYEDDDFLIRPARNAAEIVREGRTLHHCVGQDQYLKEHNDGKGVILVLRSRKMPETPYITVEIVGTRIVQWYGQGDLKPDKENMEQWLEKYVEHLETEGKESGQAA